MENKYLHPIFYVYEREEKLSLNPDAPSWVQ